eukprot:gene23185-biopygen19317
MLFSPREVGARWPVLSVCQSVSQSQHPQDHRESAILSFLLFVLLWPQARTLPGTAQASARLSMIKYHFPGVRGALAFWGGGPASRDIRCCYCTAFAVVRAQGCSSNTAPPPIPIAANWVM